MGKSEMSDNFVATIRAALFKTDIAFLLITPLTPYAEKVLSFLFPNRRGAPVMIPFSDVALAIEYAESLLDI